MGINLNNVQEALRSDTFQLLSNYIIIILVFSGCHNKIPQTRQFKQQSLVFTVLEARPPISRGCQRSYLVIPLLTGSDLPPHCALTWGNGGSQRETGTERAGGKQEGRTSLRTLVSFFEDTDPFGSGPHHYDLV